MKPNGRETSSTVFLAEEDRALRSLLTATLREGGYRVVPLANRTELMALLDRAMPGTASMPQLVIASLDGTTVAGLEALSTTVAGCCQAPMIVLTTLGDEELRERACSLGVAAVFDKPFDIDELLAAAQRYVPSANEPPSLR